MSKRDLVLSEKEEELKSRYLGKDLVDSLTAPTPKAWIKNRKIRGGGNYDYIPGSYFIVKLNNCFGFLWSFENPSTLEVNGHLVAKGRLTVHIPVPKRTVTKEYGESGRTIKETSVEYEIKDIVKEQSGSAMVKKYNSDQYATDKNGRVLKDGKGQMIFAHRAGDPISLGDDYKAAGTDALKKCGTELGLFLDIYGPREEEDEKHATEEQLDAVYNKGNEAGMEDGELEEWAQKELGKALSEADTIEALSLIPKLALLVEGKK